MAAPASKRCKESREEAEGRVQRQIEAGEDPTYPDPVSWHRPLILRAAVDEETRLRWLSHPSELEALAAMHRPRRDYVLTATLDRLMARCRPGLGPRLTVLLFCWRALKDESGVAGLKKRLVACCVESIGLPLGKEAMHTAVLRLWGEMGEEAESPEAIVAQWGGFASIQSPLLKRELGLE